MRILVHFYLTPSINLLIVANILLVAKEKQLLFVKKDAYETESENKSLGYQTVLTRHCKKKLLEAD